MQNNLVEDRGHLIIINKFINHGSMRLHTTIITNLKEIDNILNFMIHKF